MNEITTSSAMQIRFGLACVAVLVFSACISNQVIVRASNAEALTRAATIHVSVARATEPETGVLGVAPDIETELRASAENTLRAKGYAIGSASESDLILDLAPRTESAGRRTWSSDPDASGVRIVREPEAVLFMLARSRGESAEVWTCEARARLPEPGRGPATREEEVWSRVLSEALERVPERR